MRKIEAISEEESKERKNPLAFTAENAMAPGYTSLAIIDRYKPNHFLFLNAFT